MLTSVLKILIPNSFSAERSYAVKVVFGSLLGIDYELIPTEGAQSYTIQLPNGKMIILKDAFFGQMEEGLSYLDPKNIPSLVRYCSNDFIVEAAIPVLYGDDELSIQEDKISCGIDVFAAVFFMCTRWEEYVSSERDQHDRFPAATSVALKHNFLHRPVLNELAEMLWKMLLHLGYVGNRNSGKFELRLSHDIDLLSPPISLKDFAKDLLVRRSSFAFFKRLSYLLGKKNPYNSFDILMDKSEANGIKSRFYFMAGYQVKGMDTELYLDKPIFREAVQKIKQRKHLIGIHPSYNSFNKGNLLAAERKALQEATDVQVTEARQHFLRFEVPHTWQLLEDAGLKIDSTMGYSAHEGFRCGTGNTFPVFNFLSRQELKLQEMPLIVMDATLHHNKKQTIAEAKEIYAYYIRISKQYNMPLGLLFHNNIFDEISWPGWKKLVEELL